MFRQLKPLLGLILTCLFVYLASRQVQLGDLREVYARLSMPPMLLALLFLAVDMFLKIVRWWVLLRLFNPALPLHSCVWSLLVSFALNNILPLRAGDIARAFGFREALRAPAARIIGIMVIERLADLLVLLACFLLGWSMLQTDRISDAFVRLGSWTLAAGIGALVLLLFAPAQLKRFSLGLIDWIKTKAYHPILDQLRVSVEHLFDVIELVSSFPLLLRVLLISVAAWICEAAIFGVIAYAIGSPLDPAAILFVTGASTLATLIPSAPGYVGTFDYFAIQAAVLNGMATSQATVFAISVHLVLWIPVTLAGALYFIRPDAQLWWQRTRAEARQAE